MSDRRPPRSLKSFGVSGLLGDEARVYHESLFDSRNLGQVSDLLVAALRKTGVDELRLRAAVLFEIFQASRMIGGAEGWGEPATLECGVDQFQVAIGLSFRLPVGIDHDSKPIVSRYQRREAQGPFETLLSELGGFADELIVRWSPGVSRCEVVSMIRLAGSTDARAELRVIDLDEKSTEAAPPPHEYIELGDLNYPKLLEAGTNRRKSDRRGSPETEVVRGQTSEPQSNQEVRSSLRVEIDEEVHVSGGGDPEGGEKKVTIRERLVRLVKKAWSFRKERPLEAPMNSPETILVDVPDEAQADAQAHASIEAQAEAQASAEPGDVAKVLVAEFESGGLFKTVKKAEADRALMLADIKSERGRRWMNALTSDLIAERGRLSALTRKLNISLKQKELDYQSRITALDEKLKRKDEEMARKDAVVGRTREALNQATRSVEQMRASAQAQADQAQYKQKYVLLQNMMNIMKDENTQLGKRVEELRGQLAQAQVSLKSKGVDSDELAALAAKYEKVYRQAEEFKRVNRQLMEHLNDSRKERGALPPNVEDLKRRLESAVKMANNHRQEADRLRTRCLQMETNEIELLAQLEKLKSKQGAGSSGSDDSSGGASSPAA